MVEDIDHRRHEADLDEETDEDLDLDLDQRAARRQPGGDVELVLQELHQLIDQARPAPLSTAVKVDRDVVLDLLDEALARLPDDLRQARWLLKERDEFLARTHREADEILAAARGQSERMVQRSEVMKSAEGKARRIVEQARADAARVRSKCDDYCDQRLAQLEAVLEKTMDVVAKGRERLRPPAEDGSPEVDPDTVDALEDDGTHPDALLFDQDHFVDPDPTT
jgi:hypothetical protein